MTDATDRPAEVALTSSQQASIHALFHDEAPIAAPVWLARQATVPNDAVERENARQDLGPIAQPSEIEIRDSLPKTRSGKIMRRYLRATELGEDPGDLTTLAD